MTALRARPAAVPASGFRVGAVSRASSPGASSKPSPEFTFVEDAVFVEESTLVEARALEERSELKKLLEELLA